MLKLILAELCLLPDSACTVLLERLRALLLRVLPELRCLISWADLMLLASSRARASAGLG